tara:strand:- start:2499 stop:2993 length:495 start_codon:yes stop_codon:yes gene_type:complete
VKVRGTATQVCDRYLALARDASSSGDRIKAEGYLQHAEHYYRVVHGDEAQQGQNHWQNQGQGRFNGRRNNMVAPAEVALSGEQAPVYHMNEQAAETTTPPATEEKNQSRAEQSNSSNGGTAASVDASGSENIASADGREKREAVIEETSDMESTESEGNTAASA